MRSAVSLSHITAGFVAVIVGYTSSAIIIFQAAETLGAGPGVVSSWLWALGIGMGITSIGLSLFYRVPVLTAWSTPGAALLVTALSGYSLSEAVGVFIFSSTLLLVCGATGWFDKLMHFIPQSLASAMLAGVLLQFGLNLFDVLESKLLLVGSMLLTYLFIRHLIPRYVIPIVLAIGFLIANLQNEMQIGSLQWEISQPVWIVPEFSLPALIGVGLPLFIVTMASQNVPGIAVMRANGYHQNASPLIGWTGFTGVVLAPYGGFAFNLAAITAAICMGKEAGINPEKRYWASVWAGIFYLITGVFGATVAALFAAFPTALIMAIAGLALLTTIGNSLAAGLAQENGREAVLVTFLVTASGISLMGIGSAFWGLIIGLFAYNLHKWFSR